MTMTQSITYANLYDEPSQVQGHCLKIIIEPGDYHKLKAFNSVVAKPNHIVFLRDDLKCD